MKKFILIENRLTKLTPFKHFHDLINLEINHGKDGAIGFDNIGDYDQTIKLFRHNEFRAPYYLDIGNTHCKVSSWDNNESANIPIDLLLEKIHEPNYNRHWIAGCWTNPNTQNSLNDLVYVYRNKDDGLLYDVFTNNIINNSESIVSNTFFIIYGEWSGTPLFHVMLNDNLLYWPIQTIDTQDIFVDTVSYHDGKFAEYVFKPRTYGCFEHETLLITPRNKFKIDFYGRSRFYLKNCDFPFESLKLKIKTNLKYTKLTSGMYEFDMEDKQTGYLYARVNAGYGAEVEESTRMRLAYTVHRS